MVQLFVKSLHDKTLVFDFPATTPVSELRKQLAESERVPCTDLRVFSSVSDLADEEYIGSIDSQFLFASLRLKGGAKKKRKKSFTKPKKVKHKKKKLVDYEDLVPIQPVDQAYSWQQYRGRQYCGKCGLTYVSEGK
ncbi:Ubiquitin-like protein 1-40S ribosomal protein S27a [Galdieria sulphuraria]|nr:Ubiquitin-like protein 1-40S ribosomal protein S27a [Galdieria sulphuraria]